MVKQINIDTPVKNTHCPRCGYDLRGIVETWENACDISGTCSECGLEFNWSEVLHPEKYEPPWCVEFLKSGWLVFSTLKTLLISFLPWRFWHELKMSHDIHWRRIMVYLALLILPFLFIYVFEQGAIAVRAWQQVNQMAAVYPQQAATTVTMNQRALAQMEASGKVPEEHLNRIRQSIRTLQAATNQPPVINHTLTGAIAEAVFMPLADVSWGSISYSWGIQPYPAPQDIHEYVLNTPPVTFGGSYISTYYRERLFKLPILILPLFIGIPLGFLLLPVSRRKAKVRWRHIGRVTLYSLFLPIVIAYPATILIMVAFTVPSVERLCWQSSLLLSNWTLWIALLVWWAFAIRNYLKIPHGWFVAPVLAFIMVLLITLFTSYVLNMWGGY